MMNALIKKVEAGTDLSRQEAEIAMEEILSGRSDEETIVALLTVAARQGRNGRRAGRLRPRDAAPCDADFRGRIAPR